MNVLFVKIGRISKIEKTLTSMVECVSKKHVYQSAEDVSNKLAERLICQDCYAQKGQGIPHPGTMLEKQKNLTAIVKSPSSTMQGKVLSSSTKD